MIGVLVGGVWAWHAREWVVCLSLVLVASTAGSRGQQPGKGVWLSVSITVRETEGERGWKRKGERGRNREGEREWKRKGERGWKRKGEGEGEEEEGREGGSGREREGEGGK